MKPRPRPCSYCGMETHSAHCELCGRAIGERACIHCWPEPKPVPEKVATAAPASPTFPDLSEYMTLGDDDDGDIF